MEFNQKDLEKLLDIRKELVLSHEKKRDYKGNQNAIMKEVEHIAVLEKVIKSLDTFLSKYVQFS
jgi:hypothetical protein